MTSKRIPATLVALATAGLLLAGCTPSNDPAPTNTTQASTPTSTPTPTPTTATAEPPANEDEAITQAQAAITRLLAVDSEVKTGGGTDTAAYSEVAMGKALDSYVRNAERIAKGPIANEDLVNVEGQSTYEGHVIFEPLTGYGQETNGIPNGLVIIPGCSDVSQTKITTADGKPAARPASDRTKVEFQVTYDAARKIWLVSDRIEFQGETC